MRNGQGTYTWANGNKFYMVKNSWGDMAPNVQGQFLSSPMQLVFASDNYTNLHYYDLYFQFAGQNCRGLINYAERQNSAYLSCDNAYVIGNDDLFTLSLTQKMCDEENGWWCNVAIVVSGELSGSGISGLEYAIVMKDKYDPYEVLLDERAFRIYKDADGTSSRCVWEPPLEKKGNSDLIGKGGME